MLSPTLAHVRLFLHVLAACIWVGGQFALAGVVGTLRTEAPEAVKPVARAFARLAWPAFFVLVVTGLWNLVAVHIEDTDSAYQVTVMLKIVVAIASGAFAAIHTVARTKLWLALGGALGALMAVTAVFLGILLHQA
jgi:putative copper export protein